MTASVPQAAVDSAMEAMGCGRTQIAPQPGPQRWVCREHHWDSTAEWTEQGCPIAVRVAAAVVAAVQGPIKAEGVREAADEWQRGAGLTVMSPRGVGVPAIDYAQRTLDWLRARADRIEGVRRGRGLP